MIKLFFMVRISKNREENEKLWDRLVARERSLHKMGPRID
jgi:hypothetical protein